MGLIYKVTNSITGGIYIGQTTQSLLKRKIKHLSSARTNALECPAFHNAIKKYGEDSFIWEIIHVCPDGELDHYEKEYIREYDSYKNKKHYNCNEGGSIATNRNDQIYTWYHKDLGTVVGTIEDIITLYDNTQNRANLLRLISKEIYISKGWRISRIAKVPKPRYIKKPKKEYTLTNGVVNHTGSMKYLAEMIGASLSSVKQIFSGTRNCKSVKGFYIPDHYPDNYYKFVNENIEFIGTSEMLSEKTGIKLGTIRHIITNKGTSLRSGWVCLGRANEENN